MNNTKSTITLLSILIMLSAFAAYATMQIAQYSPPVQREECVAIATTETDIDALFNDYSRLVYDGRVDTWLAKDENLPRWNVIGYAKTEDSIIWNRADCV